MAMTATENNTRTFTTSKGHTVVSSMTDWEAVETIATADGLGKNVGNFARDLVASFRQYGSVTDRQRPWLHKIALEWVPEHKDAGRVESEEPKAAPDFTFPEIVGMLTRAGESLKYPKAKINLEGFGTIKLSLAGSRARYPGSVNVTSEGGYEDATWYGRIHRDGRWEPSRNAAGWVTGALALIDEDPAGAAKAYGQRIGSCCFCSRELTTDESLAAGYGPTCAENYGLPWG